MSRRQPSTYFVHPGDVVVRKVWIGWWVNASWCPTLAVRDFAIRRRGGKLPPGAA